MLCLFKRTKQKTYVYAGLAEWLTCWTGSQKVVGSNPSKVSVEFFSYLRRDTFSVIPNNNSKYS